MTTESREEERDDNQETIGGAGERKETLEEEMTSGISRGGEP